MMQLMVYAIACPLLLGIGAFGELGKPFLPKAQRSIPLRVHQIVDQSIIVIWHDKLSSYLIKSDY